MARAAVLLMMSAACTTSVAERVDSCRDRFLEPFASTSIWNTAIGSNAQASATPCPACFTVFVLRLAALTDSSTYDSSTS